MKLYAPDYYKKFSCIADRCAHICCVGWEIGVDRETLRKYRLLPDGDGLLRHITEREGEYSVTLSDGERCPFLCDSGLCCIISERGDSMIPEICREHPRFYTRVEDRIETGLGAVCEEACRLILTEEIPSFIYIGERETFADGTDFPSRDRDAALDILRVGALTYREAMSRICDGLSIDEGALDPKGYADCLSELELMNNEDRALILKDGRTPHAEEYLRRFLAYLISRHGAAAEDRQDLRGRIGFSILLTRILEGACAELDSESDVIDAARIISQEIEYSEENTEALLLEIGCNI